MERTLSGATTPGQSRPGSDGLLCIPQSSSITRAFTIWWFSVISRTLVGDRDTVDVFNSPRVDQEAMGYSAFPKAPALQESLPSDNLVSYPGHLLETEIQSMYSTVPAYWAEMLGEISATNIFHFHENFELSWFHREDNIFHRKLSSTLMSFT